MALTASQIYSARQDMSGAFNPQSQNKTPDRLSGLKGTALLNALKAGPTASSAPAPELHNPVKEFSNYSNSVMKGIADPVTEAATNVMKVLQSNDHPLFKGLQIAGHLGVTPAKQIGGAINAGVVQPIGKAIGEIPAMQSVNKHGGEATLNAVETGVKYLTDKWNQFSTNHPDAAKTIEAVGNIGQFMSLFVGDSIKGKVGDTASGIADTVAGGISDTGGKIIKGVSDIKGKVTDLTGKASETITNSTKGVVNMAEHAINRVPENVRTILTNPNTAETVKTKLSDMFEKGRNAIEVTGAPTPMEIVGQEHFSKALEMLKGKKGEGLLDTAGKAKEQALAESAQKPVGGLDETTPVFSQELEKKLGATIGLDDKGNETLVNAPGRETIVTRPADTKLILSVNGWLRDLRMNPTLQKVNDIVDRIQGILYDSKKPGAEPINTKVEGLLKNITGKLNEQAKTTGGEAYRLANENYSRLRTLYDKASVAAGEDFKNVGNTINSIFSRGGKKVKDIITGLEKETGLPIFRDSTLAKFAMDVLKDPRAKGLIEEIRNMPTSAKGWADTILRYIGSKVTDQEKAAYRILRRTLGQKEE